MNLIKNLHDFCELQKDWDKKNLIFDKAKISVIIEINKSGECLFYSLNNGDGEFMLCPTPPVRTSGIRPSYLCDTLEYVYSEKRRNLFVQKIRDMGSVKGLEWLDEVSEAITNLNPKDIEEFVRDSFIGDKVKDIKSKIAEVIKKTKFAIKFRGELVHEDQRVVDYISQEQFDISSVDSEDLGICSFTGKKAVDKKRKGLSHCLSFEGKSVPLANVLNYNDQPIVNGSFYIDEEYYLKSRLGASLLKEQGNMINPYKTNINMILIPRGLNSGEDMKIFDMFGFAESEEEKIVMRNYYDGIFTGKVSNESYVDDELYDFYLLASIDGNGSRVRELCSGIMTSKEFYKNMKQHYVEMGRIIPFYHLLYAAERCRSKDDAKDKGQYPNHIVKSWIEAIVLGKPYPNVLGEMVSVWTKRKIAKSYTLNHLAINLTH